MRNFNYEGIRIASILTALPANKIQISDESNSALAFEDQTTSDLGFLAAQEIIKKQNVNTDEIGALVFLSKTPDYRGPATAMVLQNRLGIQQNCVVYDSPTGNGGFENALNIGAALLDSIQHNYALLVIGDTISKQLSDKDFMELNFQDGATAILLEKSAVSLDLKIAISTKSKFWNSFMVPSGGFRVNKNFFEALDSKRLNQVPEHLHINDADLEYSIKSEFLNIISKIKDFKANHSTSDTLIFVNLLHPSLEHMFKYELTAAGFEANSVFCQSDKNQQTMASSTPLMLGASLKKLEKQNHIISLSAGEGLSINIASFLADESIVLNTIRSNSYFNNGFVTHEM